MQVYINVNKLTVNKNTFGVKSGMAMKTAATKRNNMRKWPKLHNALAEVKR